MAGKQPWLPLWLLLLFLAAPAGLHAAPLSLDSLIEIALRANPEILAALSRHESARYEASVAGSLPDPQLSIAALNLPKSSLSFDETPMSGLSVGLTQAIPWPGELKARTGLADAESRVRGETLRSTRNRIIRETTTTYYEYAYWLKAGLVLEENIGLAEVLAEVAETKYAHGGTSAQDLLRAKTTAARLRTRRLNYTRMEQSSLLELMRLTGNGSSVGSEFDASLPEIAAAEPSPDDDISGNPALAGADYRVEAAESRQALARSGYWPDLTVGVDYRFRKSVPGDPVRGEDYLSFKAGFTVPLWFLGKQKNQAASARAALSAARHERRATADLLIRQLSDARLALRTISAAVAQYDHEIIPQATAAFETARVAYEVDRVDFNALLSAQSDLLNIELERLELVKQYHQTQARVEELLGMEYGR